MSEGGSPFFAWLRHLNRAQRAQLDAAGEVLQAQEKVVEAGREKRGVSQPEASSVSQDAIDASKVAVAAGKDLLDAQQRQIATMEELMATQWAWLTWWKF